MGKKCNKWQGLVGCVCKPTNNKARSNIKYLNTMDIIIIDNYILDVQT